MYDRGLKEALDGYIGLLLNAPYKIDSMMWMRMVIRFFSLSCVNSEFVKFWLYKPRTKYREKDLKCGCLGF
jgi:hypothetical protein